MRDTRITQDEFIVVVGVGQLKGLYRPEDYKRAMTYAQALNNKAGRPVYRAQRVAELSATMRAHVLASPKWKRYDQIF